MPKKFNFDLKSRLSLIDQKLKNLSTAKKIAIALIPAAICIALSYAPFLLLSLGLAGQILIAILATVCSLVSGYDFLKGGFFSFKKFFNEFRKLLKLIQQEGATVSVNRWLESFKKAVVIGQTIDDKTPNFAKIVEKLDMNSLITLSVLSSIVYGLFIVVSAPLAIFTAPLITLSALHISNAVKQLISRYINKNSELKLQKLQSERQLLESKLDLRVIKPGQHVGIKAQDFGAYIPVDGILKSDSAQILEGTRVRGEQGKIRTYLRGEKVYAQTIYIGTQDIIIEATDEGDQSVSYKQLESVQSRKHQLAINKRINTILSWFVIVVFAMAILAFTTWAIISGFGFGFIIAMDIIFAACPCALGIAQYFPISILKGLLFSKNIIVHDEAIVERFKGVDTIVFDKTGTLTELAVKEINLSLTDSNLLLSLIKYAEECRLKVRPADSYALAILRHNFPGQQLNVRDLERSGLVKNIVVDNINGILIELDPEHLLNKDKLEQVYIGNQVYLTHNEFTIAHADINSDGASITHIGIRQSGRKRTVGHINFTQKIREDVKYTIKALQQQRIEVHMLTGDSLDAALKVAREVGIKYKNIQADCLIENAHGITDDETNSRVMSDKELYVKKLQLQGKKVLYVGDGWNDRAAASLANIGSIAMGAASDMSGIFSLTIENISDVLILQKVFAAVNRTQRQVLAFSLGYNLLAMMLAAIVFPLTGMVCMAGCFGFRVISFS